MRKISIIIVVGERGVPIDLNLIVTQGGVDFGGDDELLCGFHRFLTPVY